MLVATSLNVFDDRTDLIPRSLARLAAAGFGGLDFNGIDVLRTWLTEGQADAHLDSLATAAAAHGLKFVQSHGPMFKDLDDQSATGDLLIDAGLRWSARLGVPWMVMHPFTVPGATLAENHAANLAFYRPWLPLCEELGIGLALENMADRFSPFRRYCSVPEELADLADSLEHPLVGLCWDTGHAHLQRLDQRVAIGSLGARLKVVHLQDNNGGGDDHIMPYHGNIKWDDVLAGLRDARFAGALTFEVHNGVRRVPDDLRDAALALLAGIGRRFVAALAD